MDLRPDSILTTDVLGEVLGGVVGGLFFREWSEAEEELAVFRDGRMAVEPPSFTRLVLDCDEVDELPIRGLEELELLLKRMLGRGEPDSDEDEEDDEEDDKDRLLALASEILLLEVVLVPELRCELDVWFLSLSVESSIEPLWFTIDCCN